MFSYMTNQGLMDQRSLSVKKTAGKKGTFLTNWINRFFRSFIEILSLRLSVCNALISLSLSMMTPVIENSISGEESSHIR